MPQLYAARVQPHLPGYKLCLGSVFILNYGVIQYLSSLFSPRSPGNAPCRIKGSRPGWAMTHLLRCRSSFPSSSTGCLRFQGVCWFPWEGLRYP